MYINKSLTSLCCIAPVLAFSVLLGGCNKVDTSQPSNTVDTSKPNNNEVDAAIQDLYGSCPLWAVRNVKRIDGAPASDQQSYVVLSSFVLILKDSAQLQQYVVKPDGSVLASVEELAGFTNNPATSADFQNCNLRVIGQMVLNSPNHQITEAYQVQEADLYVQSERGWHLLYTNTTGINFSRETAEAQDIRDVEPITLTEDGSTSSAVSLKAGADHDSINQQQSIFHRLNLLVLSLFRHGAAHPDEQASTNSSTSPAAVAAAVSSEPAASSVADVASNAVPTVNAASVPAPAVSSPASAVLASASTSATAQPAVASTATPAVEASAPPPGQGNANTDQAAVASQVQAAKLQLLLQKAQDEFNSTQYRSAVATAEAILLLDPANANAQQLRGKALRFVQKQAAVPAIKPASSASPVRAPLVSPASAPLVLPTPTPLVSPTPTPLASPTPAQAASPVPQPPVLSAAPPAPPSARLLVLPDLEGRWQGAYQCGPYLGRGIVRNVKAWTKQVTMMVHDGHVTLSRQEDGSDGYEETLTGDIKADLSLHLSGTGHYASSTHPWSTDFTGRFGGAVGRATLKADGTIWTWRHEKSRDCHIALSQ